MNTYRCWVTNQRNTTLCMFPAESSFKARLMLAARYRVGIFDCIAQNVAYDGEAARINRR